MKEKFSLLLLFLFGFSSTWSQNGLVPSWTIQGDTLLSLNHRWTKMGDENGIFETPTNNVSVENGQFSHDETRIATVSKGDFTVRLFNAEDGEELWQSDGGAETECLAFTQGDQYIVTGGEGSPEINIWAVSNGEKLRHLAPVGVSVEGMTFHPDYNWLACGNEGGEVLIYDTSDPDPMNWPDTPRYVLVHGLDRDLTGVASDGHSDVNQMEWTKDGDFLLSAGRNGLVKVWRVADFDKVPVPELVTLSAGERGSLKSLSLNNENDLVASCGNSRTGNGNKLVPVRVIVHEIATGRIVFDYTIPNGRTPENVTFDPSGQLLLAASSFLGVEEDQARTFIWRTDAVRRGETEPSQTIDWFEQEYLDFSDAADRLIVSGNDGSVRVFDVAIDTTTNITTSTFDLSDSPQKLVVYPNPAVGQVTIEPVGFATGQQPIVLSLFNLQGQLIERKILHGPEPSCNINLRTANSGMHLLMAQQGDLRFSRQIMIRPNGSQ